ncbi:MAG TPA: glycosyltransferase family A protein [Vicinamibacterales bacterium]
MIAGETAGPLVSVVMTAYNRADLIGESIESVLRQSFTDFELIIVDDGSTDETATIASRYLSDSRVRVHRNERNLGDYPNRNYSATLARGRFLKYHDSDDVMYRHCLQVMVSALESEERADFALTSSRGWPGGPCPMLLTGRLAYEREFFGTGIFQLGPACGLFRTAFFRDLGGFPAGGVASDYLFWFKACARGRTVLVSGDLFYYREHPSQQLRSAGSVGDYASARSQAWKLLHATECPLKGPDLERAKRNFVYTVARDAYYQLRDGDGKAARTILRSLPWSVWLKYLRRPKRSNDAGCTSVLTEDGLASSR